MILGQATVVPVSSQNGAYPAGADLSVTRYARNSSAASVSYATTDVTPAPVFVAPPGKPRSE